MSSTAALTLPVSLWSLLRSRGASELKGRVGEALDTLRVLSKEFPEARREASLKASRIRSRQVEES